MKIDDDVPAKVIQRNGTTVCIRPTFKNGITRFVLDYCNQGRRKLVWHPTLADARKATNEAIDKITNGQAEVLNLKSADAHAFTRACAHLQGTGKEIDSACEEIAEIYRLPINSQFNPNPSSS